MAKMQEVQEKSPCQEFMSFVGWCVCALATLGIIVTFVTVWVNGSSLTDLRRDFDKSRDDTYIAKSELQFMKSNIQDLRSQLSALEAAWNKEHPDAKLAQNNGVTFSTTSCGVFESVAPID